MSQQADVWCVGWQNGGVQSSDGKNRVLLGGKSFGCLLRLFFLYAKYFYASIVCLLIFVTHIFSGINIVKYLCASNKGNISSLTMLTTIKKNTKRTVE